MAEKDRTNKKGKKTPSSTTSLGKRRSFKSSGAANHKSPSSHHNKRHHKDHHHHQQQQQQQQRQQASSSSPSTGSTMSNPKTAEYGSQASPLRVPTKPSELVKVTILGGAGGIGQPLALLLMLHSEYIQHLALYDLVGVHGVGADLSHIDRQCKVTTHLGPDELAEAVRGAKVILCLAGLAQKPGMSRDDLFGSNSKIMYNLAKACAQHAPQAMLAIVSNPVNSLLPLTCEVYARLLGSGGASPGQPGNRPAARVAPADADRKSEGGASSGGNSPTGAPPAAAHNSATATGANEQSAANNATVPGATSQAQPRQPFEDCFRRIFGVTTLDVVRASTLTAKSALFKPDSSGLFKDPAKVQVPVVGGHAGKTIMPLLSQAQPKLDRKRLQEDRATTSCVIESVQQAGIDVLNAKKGAGSATLAMAYAACKFTISLLRAQQGEQNIIEYAYVKHKEPIVNDLEYFSTPLLLGKDGYVKSFGLGKLLPFEERMIDEGAKELRLSVAKGEDFAKEHLSAEK